MAEAAGLRSYVGPVTNTDIWQDFEPRADDVYVCTPPKCGTTWTLNIVMMLIYGKAVPDAGNSHDAPWLDCSFRDRQQIKGFLDGLDRRRCIKTHTPLDGIIHASEPTYFVVYRHPIDMMFSLQTHVRNMKDDMLDHLFEGGDSAAFRRFLEAPLTDQGSDDLTSASLAHHYKTAKDAAAKGNVHFFHYADMTRDLPGAITRMAGIMDVPLTDAIRDEIAHATSFKQMRKAVEESERRFHKDSVFHDMADFYASGSSNKWEGRLSDAEMEAYATRMVELLPGQDVAWLNWGDRQGVA